MKTIYQFNKSLKIILIIVSAVYCAGCTGMNAKFKKARSQITSDDRNLRKEAVEILGEINNKRSTELLISALKDKSWSVRGRAAEILGKIKNPVAVEPLILAVNDKNHFVSWKAIEALGEIRDKRAVEPIINKLNSKDLRLKIESIRALGKIGEKNAAGPIISILKNSEKEIKVEICAALDQLNVIPSNNEDKVNYYITKKNWNECVNIGAPAVELLISRLKDEDTEVQIGVIGSLGRIGDNRATEPLISALSNNNSNIRGKSAEALGRIGDDRAIEPLIAALSDNDSYVRAEASAALGSIKDSRATEPLINVINDNDKKVRSKAVESLAEINRSNLDLEPIFTAIYNSKDQSYRIRLADVLSKIGEPAVDPLINMLNSDHENDIHIIAIYALGKIKNSRAVDPLVKMFKDNDLKIQLAVIGSLGAIGDVSATGPLIYIIKNNPRSYMEGSAITKKALEALSNIKDKHSVDLIITFLRGGNEDLRKAVAKALGIIGDKRAIEPLIGSLKDNQWLVRKNAVEALDKLGWAPEDKTEQAWYCIAKREWGKCAGIGKSAIKPLIDTFSDSVTFIKKAIKGTLLKIGNPSVKPLINALGHENWRIREASAETLGKFGEKQAVKSLIIALKDKNDIVRNAASRALGRIDGKYAVKPLIKTLLDKNRIVRMTAAAALDKLKWIPANGSEKALYYIAKEEWDKCVEIGKPAVKPLIDALKARNNNYDRVKESLGKIGAPAAEALVFMLDDKDRYNQQSASEILGIMVNSRITAPLVLDLRDNDWQIRMNAADILTRLNSIPADDVEKAYYFIAKREWDKCAGLGKPAVVPLLELFGNKIKNVRYADVYRSTLFSSHHSRSRSYVRGEASKALVKIGIKGDEEVVNTIKKALGNPVLKKAVKKVLKEIEHKKASGQKRIIKVNNKL